MIRLYCRFGVAAALVAASVATPQLAIAQRYQDGVVVDATTQAPIPGATVVVGGVEVLSEADGGFRFSDLPTGPLDVLVLADGYEAYLDRRRANSRWRIALRKEELGSNELIVVDGVTPRAQAIPSYDLGAALLRTLPGSGNDALKALQSLPGVARVPYGLGGLALRGSAPRDSLVYLDGVRVPILYHFGGLASFYPSTMIQSLQLEGGNYSARYGRGQGGLVEVTSRSARPDRWRVGGEISLLDASTRAEGPAPGGGSWMVGVRRSYVDAILAGANVDLTLAPRYLDAQLRWESGHTLAQGRWTAMAFASDDKITLTSTADGADSGDDGSFEYVSRFVRASSRYQRALGKTELSAVAAVGGDEVVIQDDDDGVERRNLPLTLRADLTRRSAWGWLAGGVDLEATWHRFDLGGDLPPGATMMNVARADTLWSQNTALWAEALARRGLLSIKPGLRVEYYGLSDQVVVDPRLTVLQEFGGVTVSQALGLYHQPAAVVDLDPAFGNQDLQASSALHAALGISVPLQSAGDFSATAFWRDMNDLPADVISGATPVASGGSGQSGGIGGISRELSEEQFGSYSRRENVGAGRSYGLELIARKRTGAWLGWVAYTFARSQRRGDPRRDATWYPYVLDQPHVLTALGTIPVGDWQVGARMRLATGNPITPAVGAYFETDTQEYLPVDGAILSRRLPDFFQLDLRVDRTWRRPWGTLKAFLDLQNASNRINPEGVSYNYDYSTREYTRGLPIFPSIGVEYIP